MQSYDQAYIAMECMDERECAMPAFCPLQRYSTEGINGNIKLKGNMKNFENKVAVITGGASGFGREFANVGAKLGMRLVLADVQQDALDQAKIELEAQGVQVLSMHCDVRKPDDVQMLADAAIAKFSAVHLLFNNAGVGTGGLVWENTLAACRTSPPSLKAA
jgi:hypothetical protein